MSEITLKDGRLFNSRFQDFETALADVNDYLFCEYDERITRDDVAKFEVIEKVMEEKAMKKSVSVSNLTLSLWLHFVRPVLRDLGMMDEVPAKDDWHEYTAEVIDEAVADDLEHCMNVACFNAHGKGKYSTIEEAAQMVYQLEVSVKYRKNVADAAKVIREQLAYKVSEAITKVKD